MNQNKIFEEAKKINLLTYEDDFFYGSGRFWNKKEDYRNHVIALYQIAKENNVTPNIPKNVWACKQVPLQFDASRIIDQEIEYQKNQKQTEVYFDTVTDKEQTALYSKLDEWMEICSAALYLYYPDFSVALILPEDFWPKEMQE